MCKENNKADTDRLSDLKPLLACPFCGGESEYFHESTIDGQGIFVKCKECNVKGKLFSEWKWGNSIGTFDTIKSEFLARKWWNTRSS